ncbi:MAG: LysM peptidoglycan-binding domain-containing protein [Chloroflexi bacterium]|nr:LysM peptidoglycan-binding domain-containing protein [Chloroflexota bacterium]
MRVLLLYLIAIGGAEAVTTLASPLAGVVFHALLLLTLVAHASLVSDPPVHKLYLGLSLAPLIRILSLSMPLGSILILYWYAIIAVPLLIATFICVRLVGYSRRDVGLTLRGLPLQVVVGLIGLPLGAVEYLILKPEPLADTFSFSALWLPTIIIIVGTGFTEELVFRGVLQKAALERMQGWGLIYVSALFGLLHMGYYSVVELAFVFAVGLFFAWIVRLTGSILGTTLAHGLLNSSLFLFIPLWGISVLPLGEIRLPDISFFSKAPGIVSGAHSKPASILTPMPTTAWVPTATSTPIFARPKDLVLATVSGTGDAGLNFRETPGLTSAILRVLPEGAALWVMGEEAQKDGLFWWQVRDDGGLVGWIIVSYIKVGPIGLASPTPLPTTTPTASPKPSPTTWVMSYTVAPGDTLFSIARRLGTTIDVLLMLNKLEDKNTILAYRQLNVPSQPMTLHVVATGDTLTGIASYYGTTVEMIVELNSLQDRTLVSGQRLLVPLGTALP